MLIQVKANPSVLVLAELEFVAEGMRHDRRLVQADSHTAARRYRLGKQIAFYVSRDRVTVIVNAQLDRLIREEA